MEFVKLESDGLEEFLINFEKEQKYLETLVLVEDTEEEEEEEQNSEVVFDITKLMERTVVPETDGSEDEEDVVHGETAQRTATSSWSSSTGSTGAETDLILRLMDPTSHCRSCRCLKGTRDKATQTVENSSF